MPGGIFRGGPQASPFGYLARLQRPFAAGPGARSRPLRHHWPLTGHELEVLRMLAAGRPDQAIARELVGHPGHGQEHVGYVLGKLGTANRIESVARTRVLRLIPGRGPSQPRPGHYIPTTARHQRRARLHLGARYSPEDSTRHVPFRGTPGPPDLPSVRRTERTPKGRCAMATAQPGPSNGSTALTRTAAALAS